MRIVAFVGPSGSGKTRLLVRLLRALQRRGLAVAAAKHSHHRGFDRPGTDSHRLRRAGAQGVAVVGRGELAFFGAAPADPRALARFFEGADVLLCEGFKGSRLPKIEVHRRAVGAGYLCASDASIVAAVTDEPAPRPLPTFGPGQVEALADWLCSLWGLATHRGPAHLHLAPPALRRRGRNATRAARSKNK